MPSGELIQPVGLRARPAAASSGRTSARCYQRGSRRAPYYTRWEVSCSATSARLGGGVHLRRARAAESAWSAASTTSRCSTCPRRAAATPRHETFLSQNVPNPFAGLLPGSTINGATVAAAAAAAAVPRSSARSASRNTRLRPLPRGTVQLEKRFRSGNSLTAQYTRSSLRDKLNYLNPADGQSSRIAMSPERPAEPLLVGASLRLPFGRDEKWGADWNVPSRRCSAAGRSAAPTSTRPAARSPGTASTTTRLRRSAGPRRRTSARRTGGIAGLDSPAWDTSCFYFHDAAVQTNGVDDPAQPARGPADSARATTSATSRRRCRTCAPTTCTCWTSASPRTSRCRAT